MGSTDAASSAPVPQLSLRWSEYPHSLAATFRSLKEEEDFVDVTLACNAQQFTAHRVVLSACSPYFRQLLKSNPCQHPIVILRDVDKEDMSGILRFMYNGEVQIPEDRLKEFLKTAETLQVRGLGDGEAERCQLEGKTSAPAISTTMEQDPSIDNGLSPSATSLHESLYGPSSAKRVRSNGPPSSPRSVTPTPQHSLHRERPWEKRDQDRGNNDTDNNNKNNHGTESLLSQALEKQSHSRSASLGGERMDRPSGAFGEDSASDTASDRPESLMDGMIKGSDGDSLHRGSPAAVVSSANPLFPPGLEALYRQAGFPSAFLGLAAANAAGGGGQHGGAHSPGAHSPGAQDHRMPTPTVPQVGLQSHANNPNIAGKLDMMRVRATDPRPCPRCGKIYRSAHTLRTHMEDKHTVCPGYRCVLCGTVAKSRNSLHSHMSRQHRGISTKDLPVVPMPAPFDAALASRLLSKAGVKVTPSELSARASPTAPRRSDLPKLDSNFLHLQQQQFPLPANMPTSMGMFMGGNGRGGMDQREGSDLEDLRVPPASSPFGGSNGMQMVSAAAQLRSVAGMNPKDFAAIAAAASAGGAAQAPGGMGSALLDTYLSMIAAATGNAAGAGGMGNPESANAAMAAALNFGRANPFAAAAAAGVSPPTNGDGGKDSDIEEREDMTGELGSDADNDDISDNEESSSKLDRASSPPSRGEPESTGATRMDEGEVHVAATAAN